MQKHASVFHIVMTIYAFGFIAAIVFNRSGAPTSSPEMAVRASTKPMQQASGTVGKSGFKPTSDPGVLAAPPTDHEKKI